MPHGDVFCSVHVCVARISAGGADEDRLALAVLRRHMPARTAALARKCRIDLLDTARGLLFQSTHQDAPARSEDLPVQPSLGPHITAWGLHAALGRTRHVSNPQVLDPDHIKPSHQISRHLLDPVLAGVSLAGLQSCDRGLDLSATIAAAPRPGELALEPFQAPLARWG